MRFFVPLLLLSLVFSALSLAQDIRYVSSEKNVPLRDGAGKDYRIVHRGIPAGTRLTVARTSDDGQWAEITTDDGVAGWIPTQQLNIELPAQTTVPAHTQPGEKTAGSDTESGAAVPAVVTDPADMLAQINDCDAQFNSVAQELHQLKQVSGKAEQLDIENHRLVVEQENLRSEAEMLHAENQRLLDKLESEDFMNGSLAVLLGVIIALVAPRLVPRRRKNSGWA